LTNIILAAIIDLIVLQFLFEKYPSVGPGRLTRLRARCVCNPTLASLGTKKLRLHKTIETASLQLMRAMKEAADTFESMSYVEVLDSMWRLDVPKALSDVVEALMGAVLIDSGYDYELTREVGLRLLKEPLNYVHPQLPDDPIHEFLKWVGKFGCGQVRFR
jgi:endoribonuclease Dicer